MDVVQQGTLPQIGFDAMAAIAKFYPKARVLYSATYQLYKLTGFRYDMG